MRVGASLPAWAAAESTTCCLVAAAVCDLVGISPWLHWAGIPQCGAAHGRVSSGAGVSTIAGEPDCVHIREAIFTTAGARLPRL